MGETDRVKAKLHLLYSNVRHIKKLGIYVAHTERTGCAIVSDSSGKIIYSSSKLYTIKIHTKTIDGNYAIISQRAADLGASGALGKPLGIDVVKLDNYEVIHLGEIIKDSAMYCIAAGHQLRFVRFINSTTGYYNRAIIDEYGNVVFQGEFTNEMEGIGTDIICSFRDSRAYIISRYGVRKTKVYESVWVVRYGQSNKNRVYACRIAEDKYDILDTNGNIVYSPSSGDIMQIYNNAVEIINRDNIYYLDQSALKIIPKQKFFDSYAISKENDYVLLLRQGNVWVANTTTSEIKMCPTKNNVKKFIAGTWGIKIINNN